MQHMIGTKVREYRKIRQLSVRQLASAASVSVSALEKYERGDRTPPAGVIAQLARALRVGPERLHGQPYDGEPEAEEQAQAIIPELRRILLTYDTPEDLSAPPRPLPVLAQEVRHVARMRQDGEYVPMGPLLPGLLTELTHWAVGSAPGQARRSPTRDQQEAYRLLAVAYRALNSLAHKLGLADISMTAVERVHWAADRCGDGLMQATAAYLRAGAMIRMGAYASARHVLEGLVGEIERMAPEESLTPEHQAVLGAVLLKLAIVEARDRRPDAAREWMARAHEAATMLGYQDTTHYEMSFGASNVRIHEVAALVESGDTEQALARLHEWGAEQGHEEWVPPEGLARERASHHHIDVAAARLAQGDRHGAHRDLERARRISPSHTRWHPTTRATAATLVRLDRASTESLAGFARWAGV